MKRNKIYYDLFLVCLSFSSAGIIIFEFTHEVAPKETMFLSIIDTCIATLFLGDFLFGLARSDDRSKFFKTRWYEILASVPLPYPVLQSMRSVEAFRLFRVIEVIRLSRVAARIRRMSDVIFDGPTFELFSLGMVVASIAFISATIFYKFEIGVNPGLHSFFDSFWWAMVTISTIGYGDIFPVTVEGRVLAMFLMLVGFGTLGMVTAAIATHMSKQRGSKYGRLPEIGT